MFQWRLMVKLYIQREKREREREREREMNKEMVNKDKRTKKQNNNLKRH